MKKKGYDVLFDDRQESPGVKFKDGDLIGISNRIVVGRKISEGIVEYKNLVNNEVKEIKLEEVYNMEF